MNDISFEYAVYRLLQEYPLYHYRESHEEGYRLPVLLIGEGIPLNKLRSMILSNGQLLDTDLEVTVVTENSAAALAALRRDAPDLERFIELREKDTTVCAEWKCGTLRFEEQSSLWDSIPAILDRHPECGYVLISADSIPYLPAEIAAAPGRMIAWTKKWEPKDRSGQESSYAIHVRSPEPGVFSPVRDDKSMEEILDIAYRLHYAYAKGNDPYITNREIREGFEVPYNYKSNIECALHVRSKIVSANIDPKTLVSAAEQFASKMAEDARNGGNLLERLAQLEHRRWCVSKAAGGRRCNRYTVKRIYGSNGSTTHSNEWHVALVPYRIDSRRYRPLSEQDWLAENPGDITGLDELDMQTLRVHRQCGRITAKKLTAAEKKLDQLEAKLTDANADHVAQMKEAVARMRTGSREAVFTYRHHFRLLEAQYPRDKSGTVNDLLKALDQAMGAPIEYLTRKDYKKQNLVLVGSIPFALCGWKSTVLVKLMAESVHECVAAAWQLEPARIVFVDTAETLEEVKNLSRKARQIDRFLSRNCNQVQSSYHIFVPEGAGCSLDNSTPFHLHELKKNYPTFFDSSDWHLYYCPSLEAEELRLPFVEVMHTLNATSIDVTGGKPTLISLADGYGRYNRVGTFFIRNNRIRDFCGAKSMEYQALDKGLSVQQLFDQTDIVLSKREDEDISQEFYKTYKRLWAVAHTPQNVPVWHRFCTCFSQVYRDKKEQPHPNNALRVPVKDLHAHIDKSYPKEKDRFDTILRDLQNAGLLTCDDARMFYQASCEEVVACLRNSGKVLEYYICCTAKQIPDFKDAVMSWTFRHNDQVGAAKNEVDVICTGHDNTALFISAKNVSLASLGKNNFLNYVCYEVGWLADRFGGASVKTILAAPNVPQFEDGHRSELVRKAMNRGVYLLGGECFEDDNLTRVLQNIHQGQHDWCEFLLGEAEPASV